MAAVIVKKGYATEQLTAIARAMKSNKNSDPWPHLAHKIGNTEASKPRFNDPVKTLKASVNWLKVQEHGHLKNGLKKRVLTQLKIDPGATLLAPIFTS